MLIFLQLQLFLLNVAFLSFWRNAGKMGIKTVQVGEKKYSRILKFIFAHNQVSNG